MSDIDTQTLRTVALGYDIVFGKPGEPKNTRRGDIVRKAANEIDILREIIRFIFSESVDVGECQYGEKYEAESDEHLWKYYGVFRYMADYEDDTSCVNGDSYEEVAYRLLMRMKRLGFDCTKEYPLIAKIKSKEE